VFLGVVALTRVKGPREVPLAATPLLFALQQCIEGSLWLSLPQASDGSLSAPLTVLYLFFAESFWPLYAPIAVWLIEPNQSRRHFMVVCLGVGAGVGAYLLWSILGHPHFATISDGHIVYVTEYRHSDAGGAAYLTATGLPPLLSSQRSLVVLGAIVLAGLVVAYAFYWESFISVWCYFAAAASVAILGHFEWSRRSSEHITNA
jgi:peptidoglycan/LPS O-acetylase OafA/YrhL